jgi:hypothetical protein
VDIRPFGPKKVLAKFQVTVGQDVLDLIGVGMGDEVWIAANPDRPGTLVIIPAGEMSRVFEKGWTAAG